MQDEISLSQPEKLRYLCATFSFITAQNPFVFHLKTITFREEEQA
jgi:hypothetical protein